MTAKLAIVRAVANPKRSRKAAARTRSLPAAAVRDYATFHGDTPRELLEVVTKPDLGACVVLGRALRIEYAPPRHSARGYANFRHDFGPDVHLVVNAHGLVALVNGPRGRMRFNPKRGLEH